MNARMLESTKVRLARLESAVAARSPAKAAGLIPAQQAVLLLPPALEYLTLPSARPLQRAFATCCTAFPTGRDVQVTDPAIADFLSAVRQELAAFLRSHLGTDEGIWDRPQAWPVLLEQQGCRRYPLEGRERGPTAEQWCAALSDAEVLFEAADCLLRAAVRAIEWKWWGPHTRPDPEGMRLPAEEAAVLSAEIASGTAPPDLRTLLMEM